jgi:hypothetical protein
MKNNRFLSPLLGLAVFAAACGGGDQADVAETPEAQPEMTAAAPTSPCYLSGATLDEARSRPSPLMETAFSVGGHDGTLCYGAPSAKGRTVMGELVPFGEAWRAGANEATAFHLTGPAQIGGVELQPGSYSLYAVPGETEWQFFLNSNVERWGIPIGDDVRVTEVGTFTAAVEPTDSMVETLTYRFVPWEGGTMGDVFVEWENTRVKFHLHPVG